MQKTFLLVDPDHEYASRFIDLVVERFGYRPLCIVCHSPSRSDRSISPQLRLLERKCVPDTELETFARALRTELDVQGAIPFSEAVLGPVLALLRGLGSTWNHPSVLTLLQDKFALKQHLRETHPELEVGASYRVSVQAGLSQLPDPPQRFVLKPNRSYGNRWVGFFDSSSPRETIQAFMDASGASEFVLEEYHDGQEFFINGQVDERGQSTAVAAFAYEKIAANGRLIDWLTYKVPHCSPEFVVLDRYAAAVMSAIGLRRSPFHLEVKLLDGVPKLIELGARLAGNRNALVCNRLHRGKLDVFALAADHYLHEGATSKPELDWDFYDAADLLYVHGVSDECGRIYELHGIDAVERHPMFAEWVKKPALGQKLTHTVDMFSSPWSFILRSSLGLDALREAAEELRAELRINPSRARLRRASMQVAGLRRLVTDRMPGPSPAVTSWASSHRGYSTR